VAGPKGNAQVSRPIPQESTLKNMGKNLARFLGGHPHYLNPAVSLAVDDGGAPSFSNWRLVTPARARLGTIPSTLGDSYSPTIFAPALLPGVEIDPGAESGTQTTHGSPTMESFARQEKSRRIASEGRSPPIIITSPLSPQRPNSHACEFDRTASLTFLHVFSMFLHVRGEGPSIEFNY
jgi:hypothetical protein